MVLGPISGNDAETIARLVEALRPFADLMEYPQEWPKGEMFPAQVDPEDVARAQQILAELGQ